jgi:uroporphyrinogen-III decarboxylase
MFNAYETIIDAIQTAKKTAIATFVKNEVVADSLTKWTDAETQMAKNIIKAGAETATVLSSELTKAAQEAAKVDMAKGFTTWVQDVQKNSKGSK